MTEIAPPLIDAELAARIVERALAHGGDFAEVFCEQRAGFGLAVDESRVERVQRGAERGAGVRVVRGETTYFAHVDGLGEADLERAADAVAAALRGERREPQALRSLQARRRSQEIETPPGRGPGRAQGRPASRLRRDRARRRRRDRAGHGELRGGPPARVTVANSEGPVREPTTARGCASASRWSRGANGTVETGFETLGGHRGFELVDGGARRAHRRARRAGGADAARRRPGPGRRDAGGGRRRLRRRPLPRDDRPRARGRPHPEGRLGLRGKLGEQVAGAAPRRPSTTAGCPASGGRTGSTTRERPAQRTAVIHEGRITSYLYDLVRARKDGVDSTGNGRRESFRHLPIPRMTNTYIAPGEAEPEELIAEVDKRLLRRVVRRRPGGPDDGRLRLRRLRGLPDRGRQGDQAVPRRDPDRQLPRRAGARSTRSPTTSR